VRDQGFIKSSEAPADPDLTGFPPKAYDVTTRKATIEYIYFFMISIFLFKIQLGQMDVMFQTI